MIGTVLGKVEGLGEVAFAIEMGDEGACVESIDATRGEDDPLAIAAP